jgi:hypothetical protein
MLRRKPLLALAAIVLGATVALAASTRIISVDAHHAMSVALNASEQGETMKAMATLKSLLLDEGVTVGIDRSTLPGGAQFERGVHRGIRIWTDSLQDSPFRFTDEEEGTPGIVVKFVDRIPYHTEVQGLVEVKRDLHWSRRSVGYRITGTIFVRHHTDGRWLTEEEVACVVGHELGHVLGLDDNKTTRGIMGMFVPGKPRLKPLPEEIAAVNEYRGNIRASMARISSR